MSYQALREELEEANEALAALRAENERLRGQERIEGTINGSGGPCLIEIHIDPALGLPLHGVEVGRRATLTIHSTEGEA